jgi:hypothetical protein
MRIFSKYPVAETKKNGLFFPDFWKNRVQNEKPCKKKTLKRTYVVLFTGVWLRAQEMCIKQCL